MTDFYLTGHDADDVNSYLVADGDDWVTPPSLPGATDRVMIAGMRSGNLSVAAVLGYSGNFNPSPSIDSPAAISGGTVTAGSAPLGLAVGNSFGHTFATVTIDGEVEGDVGVTDGDVRAASIIGNVSVFADGTVTAASIIGAVAASGGGRVSVSGDVDASDGSIAVAQGNMFVVGKIMTQGFSTGDGGVLQAASIAYDGTVRDDGTVRMLNYMDGGQVTVGDYNINGIAGLSSRLDVLEGARITVTDSFGSGRLLGDIDGVTVSGQSSYLQIFSNLVAGDLGQSNFTVSNGGLVGGIGNLTLGKQQTGVGMISVDGGDSEFNLLGNLLAGDQGEGSLSVTTGGVIAGVAGVTLGRQQSGTGRISVDGEDSQFFLSGKLVVGDQGRGTLTLNNRAQVSLNSVTLGSQQSGNGDIHVNNNADLVATGTMTLGAKGRGTLSLSGFESTVELKKLALGVSAGGDGTVEIADGAKLKVKKSVTIGDNGSGVVIMDAGFLTGDQVSIGSKGKLTLDDHSLANLGRVTTIEKNGVLALQGDFAWATLDSAEISGRMSVSGGFLHVTNAMDGNGEITIGKGGTLRLGGVDHGVDIGFTSGKAGTLVLDHADLLNQARIKGFAKSDEISFNDLRNVDVVLGVARKGANTIITIRDDDGEKLGVLTLAGHYAKSGLDFEEGVLTTDGAVKRTAHTGSATAATMMADDFLFAGQSATESAGDHGYEIDTKQRELTDDEFGSPDTGSGGVIPVHDPYDGLTASGAATGGPTTHIDLY